MCVPTLVEYPDVLRRMTAAGYRSLYHNSGAFGFAAGVETVSRGWIGPEDLSIRDAARSIVHQAVEPFEQTMVDGLRSVWQDHLPGPIWVMPRSHWSYELQFGHRDWLPDLLREIGIDPKPLEKLNNAPAVVFAPGDAGELDFFVRNLLCRLVSSDFQIVFPGHPVLCTLHTRCQLWWTTTRPDLIAALDKLI